MRHLIIMAVLFSFMLSACGLDTSRQLFQTQMTEDEAMSTLADMPYEAAQSDDSTPSAQGLEAVIAEAVASGQVQGRGAVNLNAVDTSQLSTLLGLLGQNQGLGQVAQGMVNSASGNTTQAKFNLDSIVALLQAVLPMVATVAPQYAPVIQAVLTLIPVIKLFIGMMKKKA